jgi:ketosteroid isomerase-like protein
MPARDQEPDSERFTRAIAAIDTGNADDPNIVTIRARAGPKEVLHAELVTEWVERLRPDASEPLLLAARGHHYRRWTVPRASAPAGRAGYLRWRKSLQQQHARELGELLSTAGYDRDTVARVQAIVRKEGLAHDDEVQALEDALCLVFLETQLDDIVARLDTDTLTRVLVRTAQKMSRAGRAAIADVPIDESAITMLTTALARDVVERYLAGLAAHDWDAVAATLAPDVERMGPYRDKHRGREPYAKFLAETIGGLGGYRLDVDRVLGAGPVVTVELRETVDDGDARLETSEAVIFDTDDGLITEVAVYLQTSERHPPRLPE